MCVEVGGSAGPGRSGGPALRQRHERPRIFAGCQPEIAASVSGHIVGVGPAARASAGRNAERVDLRGEVLPGLSDSHVHLESLARLKLEVDLTGSRSIEEALARIRRHAARLTPDSWVVGRGWYNDAWPDTRFPSRDALDSAAGGRPAFLLRRDGHSAWVSSAALSAAGIGSAVGDPPGGVVDRDESGRPTGIVRENALRLVQRYVPWPSEAELDSAMASTLRDLSRLGLTSVHSMDHPSAFASLSRLHRRRSLPVRVSYNIPAARLEQAQRLGIVSGLGDDHLRIWGVKAFLDGSLGSGTAEMLTGAGIQVLPQEELLSLVRQCAGAGLNLCLHAIGDGAVRRALDAFQAVPVAWPRWQPWRPRIEHAQCVDPADVDRFARVGVVASMQPIQAISDRELADREWGERVRHAYAWRALVDAGAVLAFGSDTPVETADPLPGLDAAIGWRRRSGWHPSLALTRAQALRAYTWGAAYACGMEDRIGRLRPGMLCDLTVVHEGRVTATVVGGEVTFRARPEP